MILLRFSGDVSTKARATRSRFVARLLSNLRDALHGAGIEAELHATRNRVHVDTDDPAAPEVLSRVFGVQSLSVVEARCAERLEDVVGTGAALFGERVRGRRFAVRARRVGNRHEGSLSAREVERELGTALLPDAARVDLDHPEVVARVELCEGEAFLFGGTLPGPGGLPLGVEGRAVALVSGGFDSAVAAWYVMRRGVALDLVFCNLGGASHELGTLRVAKELVDRWAHGERPVLHAVDFAPLMDEIRGKTAQRYWQILLKRLMVRAACAVARERRCEALVTGDALGQVSSQTLTNLAVVGEAAELPILRPLVGANKEEIIAWSRVVGTHDLSRVVDEYCAMVPRRPATHASLGAVLEEEAALDLSLLDAAVSARRLIDLRGISLDAIGLPELETTDVPEAATVIDLRPRPAYAAWHWPDAVRLDFSEALRVLPSLDPGREYVLYCEFGLMSAHLAELMQKQGLRARHVRGGTATLRRLAGGADRAG